MTIKQEANYLIELFSDPLKPYLFGYFHAARLYNRVAIK